MIPFEFVTEFPPGAIEVPLDASSLKMAYCQQAYTFSIIRGYRESAPAEALCFGKAVHRFAELSSRGASLVECFTGAQAEWKVYSSDTKLLTAVCGAMPRTLPKPAALPSGPGVEFYFRAPWIAFRAGGVLYCIVVCGTIDLLNWNNNLLRIIDYKTSSKWKDEDIFAGYENDTQITFYLWAMYKFGHLFLPPEMANAARECRMSAEICAVKKSDKYPKWVFAPAQYINPERAELFEEELMLHLQTDIMTAWESPTTAARNGWVSGRCGQCRYNSLCHTQDEDMFVRILDTRFFVHKYEPKNHGKAANEVD